LGCGMKNDDSIADAIRAPGENSRFPQDNHSIIKMFTPAYLLRGLLFFAASYIIFLGISHFSWWLLIEKAGIEITNLDASCWPGFIIVFVLFFLPLLYFLSSFVAKKFLSIHVPKLVLYMGCTFFGAMWFEVILDTLFVKFIGYPGWLYKVWPVHQGYTSGVGMFMWPLYGFFVYCINQAIATNPRLADINNVAAKAFFYALDAMALEILTNIFTILLFHTYLFYYLPGDLKHFTTIQIFLPYLFVSGLGVTLSLFMERIKTNHFFIGLAFYFAGVGSLLFLV
jgi:hypothetical protein